MGYAGGGTIPDGLNDRTFHAGIVANLTKNLPLAAEAGVPNVVAFFGNRRGRPDADGIANCAEVLRQRRAVAERHGVTVCVELLNSKVNHKDYHVRPHRVGRRGVCKRWARRASSCSTTSTTCRSWKAT